MKIKSINDVVPYLDGFYFMEDFDRTKKAWNEDRNGNEFMVFSAVANEFLFKDTEKVLSKMLISHIMNKIENEEWLLRKESGCGFQQWIIEWRTRPEYEAPTQNSKWAKIYARFSIYPRPIK